jgi:hypothetical protein
MTDDLEAQQHSKTPRLPSTDNIIRTKIQDHISSSKQLDLKKFIKEIIRVNSYLDYPVLNHDFLLGALSRSNFPVTSDAGEFIDYLLRQASSVGSSKNQEVVALGDMTCACIGLNENPSFKSRCERFREVINERARFVNGADHPSDGSIRVYFLYQFVTDHQFLQPYSLYPEEGKTLSFKNFCGIIAKYHLKFPGLLAGVSKSSVKEEVASIEKTKWFKRAAERIRMNDDDDDDENSLSSSSSKNCLYCMYLEWGLCFLIIAMAAASVLAGNWAVAQMLVRDSNFSEAGAYWTTSAIDFSALICFFLCWMQCCRSSSSVCKDRKPVYGRPANPGYDYLDGQQQLLGKLRAALGQRNNSGHYGDQSESVGSSSKQSFNGDQQSTTAGSHQYQSSSSAAAAYSLPKWAQKSKKELNGNPSRTENSPSLSRKVDAVHLSSFSKSDRNYNGQINNFNKNNMAFLYCGYLWRLKKTAGWGVDKRKWYLRDLRNEQGDKNSLKKNRRGTIIAEFHFPANRKRDYKTISVTTSHYVDANPRKKEVRNAPTEYCFALMSEVKRARDYFFCAETSEDKDIWLHTISSLIDVHNWKQINVKNNVYQNNIEYLDRGVNSGGYGVRSRANENNGVGVNYRDSRQHNGGMYDDRSLTINERKQSLSDEGGSSESESRHQNGEHFNFNERGEVRRHMINTNEVVPSLNNEISYPEQIAYKKSDREHWSTNGGNNIGISTKNYEQQDPRNYSYDDPVQSQLNELDNMLDDDSQWD